MVKGLSAPAIAGPLIPVIQFPELTTPTEPPSPPENTATELPKTPGGMFEYMRMHMDKYFPHPDFHFEPYDQANSTLWQNAANFGAGTLLNVVDNGGNAIGLAIVSKPDNNMETGFVITLLKDGLKGVDAEKFVTKYQYGYKHSELSTDQSGVTEFFYKELSYGNQSESTIVNAILQYNQLKALGGSRLLGDNSGGESVGINVDALDTDLGVQNVTTDWDRRIANQADIQKLGAIANGETPACEAGEKGKDGNKIPCDKFKSAVQKKFIKDGIEELRRKADEQSNKGELTKKEYGRMIFEEGNFKNNFSPSEGNSLKGDTYTWNSTIHTDGVDKTWGCMHSHPMNGSFFSPGDLLIYRSVCDKFKDDKPKMVVYLKETVTIMVDPTYCYSMSFDEPELFCEAIDRKVEMLDGFGIVCLDKNKKPIMIDSDDSYYSQLFSIEANKTKYVDNKPVPQGQDAAFMSLFSKYVSITRTPFKINGDLDVKKTESVEYLEKDSAEDGAMKLQFFKSTETKKCQ